MATAAERQGRLVLALHGETAAPNADTAEERVTIAVQAMVASQTLAAATPPPRTSVSMANAVPQIQVARYVWAVLSAHAVARKGGVARPQIIVVSVVSQGLELVVERISRHLCRHQPVQVRRRPARALHLHRQVLQHLLQIRQEPKGLI